MPRCKLCGKKGWFLWVSPQGLCRECLEKVMPVVQRSIDIINESVKIIKKSRDIDTILSRTNLVLSHLEDLKEYEEKDIPIMNPLPSQFLIDFRLTVAEKIDDILFRIREQMLNTADSPTKAGLRKIKTTIRKLEDLIQQCEEIPDNELRSDLISALSELRDYVSILHYDAVSEFFHGKINEAEFKNQKKRVLNLCYDWLYYIETELNPSDKKSREMQRVAIAKIKELGGKLPPSVKDEDSSF